MKGDQLIFTIVTFMLLFPNSPAFSQLQTDTFEVRPSCAVEVEHLKRINYFANARQLSQNDSICTLSLRITESKGWRFGKIVEIFYDGSECYLVKSNYGFDDKYITVAANTFISELVMKLNETYALDSTIIIKIKQPPPYPYYSTDVGGGSMKLEIKLSDGQTLQNSLKYESAYEYCTFYPLLYDFIMDLFSRNQMKKLNYSNAQMLILKYKSLAASQYLEKSKAILLRGEVPELEPLLIPEYNISNNALIKYMKTIR